MDNQLFRKRSMERISSPEELHDYMQVTSPRLWMILAAIVVLLAGLAVYASTATMENILNVTVNVENSVISEAGEPEQSRTAVTCVLDPSQKDIVNAGMEVRVAGEKGVISFWYMMEDQLRLIVEMEKDDLGLPDGQYPAQIVVESTTPISFLLN